jgi:hypothetical protein
MMSSGFQQQQLNPRPRKALACGRCKRSGHFSEKCEAPYATHSNGEENLGWRPLLNSLMYQYDENRISARLRGDPPDGAGPGRGGGRDGGRGGRGAGGGRGRG